MRHAIPLPHLPLLPLVLIATACDPASDSNNAEAFETLVQSERAFASTSLASGTRAAFLEFFAADGVVFDAGPVNAHEVWEQRPAEGPVLSWGPEIAEVSAAGDMGYTSGPYELRQSFESAPVAWGHFVSVWKRNADGTWNVIADGGAAHGPATLRPDSSVLRVGSDTAGAPLSSEEIEIQAAALSRIDSEYSRSVVELGFRESVGEFVDPSARFNRNGQLPLVGLDVISQAADLSMGFHWVGSDVRDVRISKSGDMGVSYGIVEFAGEPGGASSLTNASYYRIWRRASDAEWRVVVDVLIPIAPSSE